MRRFHFVIMIGIFATLYTVRGSAQITIASTTGCYSLKVGAWSRAVNESQLALPSVVKLDTLIWGRSTPNGFQRLYLDPTDTTDWRELLPSPDPTRPTLAIWGITAGDSIKMHWSKGLSGDVIVLVFAKDTLKGYVQANSDVVNPKVVPSKATITGVRSACPAGLR